MIINSITLDNFKSHKHSHLDLNEGISLILGENGAGKSSIFEAISYSFFKDFTGKIDDLIRKSEDENDIVKEMKVTVNFENNGTHYQLVRGKKKSSNIAKLFTKENDKLNILCNGDRQVTHEIETILELDQKAFLNAVYIRQGDITELIEKTAAERKEFIAKLLGIDGVEKAWEEIKKIIDIYKDKRNENTGRLHDKDEVEENIESYSVEIKEKNTKLDEYKPQLESAENELKRLSEDITVSDNNKTLFVSNQQKLDQQRKIISNYNENKEKQEKKLKEIESYEKESVELEKYVKIQPHLDELKDTRSEIDKKNSELKPINLRIKEYEDNKIIYENKKKFYDEYQSVNKEIENLKQERSDLSESVNNNRKITVKLEEKRNQKDSLVNSIRKVSDSASKLFNENFSNPEDIERKVSDEKVKTESNKKHLIDKINDNNNEISAKRSELNTTKKSLSDLENTQDTCPICQSEISHEKHEELSAKYQNRILTLENRISELEDANENQEKTLDKTSKRLEDLETINISKLKDDFKSFNDINVEIGELEEKIPAIEAENKRYDELEKNIDEKEQHLKSLEDDKNAYIVASENLKKVDIEKEKSNRDTLDHDVNMLKSKCNDIIRRYRVGDNLEHQIKFVKTQVARYNEIQGMIADKNSVIKEKENMINKIREEENTLQNIETEINNLNYNDEENKKLHETYASKEKDKEKMRDRTTVIETEIRNLENNLNENKNKLEELEKVAKEQEHLNDYIKLLEDIRELYDKDHIQKELREQAKPDIERNTVDYFNEFDFDYSSLKLDENYDVTIENKNGEFELKMMSGGEKIVIALALRLGIARVVSKNKTELLLLDEPTIHLDAERRSRLIDIIATKDIVPQMIVVSHDDEMEALSNNIIKIQKIDGISSIDNS